MSESDRQPVLIAGQWRPADNPVGSFQPHNPSSGEPLPDQYPTSGREDVLAALEAAQAAAEALRWTPPAAVAAGLERFADLIEANRVELVELAHRETGLAAEPRLNTTCRAPPTSFARRRRRRAPRPGAAR
jgi:NADP-dependent aldehyde dehydrogenase